MEPSNPAKIIFKLPISCFRIVGRVKKQANKQKTLLSCWTCQSWDSLNSSLPGFGINPAGSLVFQVLRWIFWFKFSWVSAVFLQFLGRQLLARVNRQLNPACCPLFSPSLFYFQFPGASSLSLRKTRFLHSTYWKKHLSLTLIYSAKYLFWSLKH